jgi:hypothetical protein
MILDVLFGIGEKCARGGNGHAKVGGVLSPVDANAKLMARSRIDDYEPISATGPSLRKIACHRFLHIIFHGHDQSNEKLQIYGK